MGNFQSRHGGNDPQNMEGAGPRGRMSPHMGSTQCVVSGQVMAAP